jgi:hypothetical protein
VNFRTLVWLLAIASAHVAAQTAPSLPSVCPLPQTDLPPDILLAPRAVLQDRLQTLDAMAGQCLDQAAFHAQRGVLLHLLGQPSDAIEALERSLLLVPDQPGTLLDYALALRAVGDPASATALLTALSQRTDVPAALQPLLQRQLAQAAAPADAVQYRMRLSTALAADSNLNNAPSASSFTLTLPWGNANLALEEASRAQPGAAWLNTLQAQALKPTLDGQLWVLQADLRTRHTEHVGTDYQQAELVASWLQAPAASRQWQARLALGSLAFGGQALQQTQRAAVLHQWRLPAPAWAGQCRPQAGLELELRRYPAAPSLDGRYQGFVAAMACGPEPGQAEQPASGRLHLQLRLGQDQAASPQRPGADSRTAEWRAGWGYTWRGHEITADYSIATQQDASGYSPLLANNEARHTLRHTLHLELAAAPQWRAPGGGQWFVAADATLQTSNLGPFATRGQAVYTGLRWVLL